VKKHKLYKLFALSNYELAGKSLKKVGASTAFKELNNRSCFDLPAFFAKHTSLFGLTIFPTNFIDLLIFASEYLWATSTRTVIYPRSVAEIDVISKSSFKGLDLSLDAGEMMIIASPPDSDIPPLLTGCLYPSQAEKFNSYYQSQVTIPYGDALEVRGNIFVVIFHDPDSDCFLTYEVAETEIESYAKAATTEEIVHLMERAASSSVVGDITHEDRVKQAKLIKIALNFWMYKICSPSNFIHQTPPVHAREHFGSKPTSSYTLSFEERLRGSMEGVVSEVGIHMRNLRDERYYTSDEWKGKPRGSRWVEVGPYTRGGKGEMIVEDGIDVS
jgi:hypothetical protein